MIDPHFLVIEIVLFKDFGSGVYMGLQEDFYCHISLMHHAIKTKLRRYIHTPNTSLNFYGLSPVYGTTRQIQHDNASIALSAQNIVSLFNTVPLNVFVLTTNTLILF